MQRSAKIGYLIGSLFALAAVIFFSLPSRAPLLAKGKLNSGHETLSCRACHEPATGTFRQQLQANVKYWLGRREAAGDFGYQAVTSEGCLACHARLNDKHPISRFLEPRFAQARQAIEPQQCNSCHAEHNGRRVTIAPNYCSHCHEGMKMKDDPLSVSHQQLAAEKNWMSCLTCHDFHGNHRRETPKEMDKAIPIAQIESYFAGGRSPYADKKEFYAIKEK
jgi:hypothetical protein